MQNYYTSPAQAGSVYVMNLIAAIFSNYSKVQVYLFKGASTSKVIGARNEMMIMMAKRYSGTLWA